MEVLFFLCFLLTPHLLFHPVSSDDDPCAASPAKCNHYPFGSARACALSDSFVLSNCSSSDQVPSWDSFLPAMNDSSIKPPSVEGIFSPGGSTTFVNLTWNRDLLSYPSCNATLQLRNLSQYMPASISLTDFGNSTLQFSGYNVILLFNCTNNTDTISFVNKTVPLIAQSVFCTTYTLQCHLPNRTSCIEVMPVKDLMMQQIMENLTCKSFQFFVTVDNTPSVSEWKPGVIQLLYNDLKCQACISTKGSCLFDNYKFTRCACPGNEISDTDCDHIIRCDKFSCSTGAKVATGVALAVVATVFLMMLALWAYRRRRGYYKSFPSSSSNRLWTQRAIMLSRKFGPASTKEFSFEELLKATDSFADENMIGDGGFGAVYLGVLKDDSKVAIKRLYHDNFRRMDHFYNEIKILSKIDHPNLVKLHGFCCQDSSDLLLVFEYASNGTVSDQLHDATKPMMPWKTRLTIARETAEALSYLHNSVSPPIFHRDVKTTNILLDDNLHAKLADFGLSRLVPLEATHVSTAPQGTPGYLDPDYHHSYQLTDKSDVYSFGVVLIELVSAKLAVDMSRDRREINLSSLALMKIGCGAWEELVDPRLEIKKAPDVEKMVKQVVELAFMCLHAEKDDRPTMLHVVAALTNLCKEFGYYESGDEVTNNKVDLNAPLSADETSHLIKTQSAHKVTSSTDSVPSTTWTSSNTSSYVNSF